MSKKKRTPRQFTKEELKSYIMINEKILERFHEVKHSLLGTLIDECFLKKTDAMIAIEEILKICREIVKQFGKTDLTQFNNGMKMIEKYLDETVIYPELKKV